MRLAHYKNDDITQGFGGTELSDLALNKEFGRRFGAAIVQALKNPSTPVQGRIRAAISSVALPVEKPEPKEYFVQAARGEAVPQDHAKMKAEPWIHAWYIRFAKWMLSKYEQGAPMPESVGPYEMRVMHFGDDLTVVALDGEVFTCVGQKIEQRLAPRPTFVLGYNNNVRAYMPCSENLAPPQNGGNYEIQIYTWWLWQTARFKPTVDKVIVDETVAVAQKALPH